MDIEVGIICVLGGLLFILIAIVGGGFNIREITIPIVPKWMRVVSFIVGLGLLFMAYYPPLGTPSTDLITPITTSTPDEQIDYRVIFTTGLTEDKKPLNNLKNISLNEEAIHIYITWFAISKEKHDLHYYIYDGSGRLVHSSQYSFEPTESTWNTLKKYYIVHTIDKPGDWKFIIHLDGKKVIHKTLDVTTVD